MPYGDGHADHVARESAALLQSASEAAKKYEAARSRKDFNAGLHTAQMLIHARWAATHEDETKRMLEELEKAIELAKIKET